MYIVKRKREFCKASFYFERVWDQKKERKEKKKKQEVQCVVSKDETNKRQRG